MKIAALLTCYNRKEKTLKCLSSLYEVIPSCGVYLVDDGSTDGTADEVERLYPSVKVIKGSGNLFWSRGMYRAWSAAIESGHDYDFYLWLNDDVELYPFFFEELLECNKLGGTDCIISGLIEDKQKTKILYGGYDAQKRLVQEDVVPNEITFMNGNVVLVPMQIVSAVGIIDPEFHHDLGDVDYGLSAREHGYKILSTRKAIAAGYSNNFCRVRKWGTTLAKRFKSLSLPLGSPLSINFYFRKKHFGIIKASLYCSYLILINLMPDRLVFSIWGDRYTDK